MANVGIVIVSHSPKVAEGAADMVRQMVGKDVPLAWTGGNPVGGLGTSFEAITDGHPPCLVGRGRRHSSSILAAPRPTARWRSRCLPEDKRGRVVVCNAPIVEGAVIAATEASGGASLADGATHGRGVVRMTVDGATPDRHRDLSWRISRRSATREQVETFAWMTPP